MVRMLTESTLLSSSGEGQINLPSPDSGGTNDTPDVNESSHAL